MIVIRAKKKPIRVDAVHFDGSKELASEISVHYAPNVWPEFGGEHGDEPTGRLIINTPEGKMVCEPGDYIITGVKGERYPIKPDIFKETYEVVGGHNEPLPPSGH